jgi:hypothetical protein
MIVDLPKVPQLTVATEGYEANVADTARRLHRCGARLIWTQDVRGHENVPTYGQLRSPLVATRSPRSWPAEVPTPR